MNDTSKNNSANQAGQGADDESAFATPGEAPTGHGTRSDSQGPEPDLAQLQKDRDQLEQQLQRTLADTANMRRRQQKELQDGQRRVIEGLTQELLPVLDMFQMALQSFDTGADAKPLFEGLRMTQTLLRSALERHGLREIPAAGCAFDPARHEAVAVEPTRELPDGHILRVLQPGYLLGEHVVRFSRVVVAGASGGATKEN